MKKKLLSVTVALTVLLLGAGFYTALASSSGYEAYKEALKETHKMKNGVANIDLKISNNGELLQDLTVQSAFNLEEQRSVANINVNTLGENVQMEIYKEEKHVYIKNAETDTTYVIESDRDPSELKEKHERFHNKELLTIAELVVDTLTSPLHDSFVMGSDNSISINMTNDEMPEVIQAIGAYMVKKSFEHHANIEMTTDDYPFLTNTYKQVLPALTDEINFEEIKVDVQLNKDGTMKNQQAFFRISGKDQDGKLNTIEVQFNIGLENMNETNIAPFSAEGKKLETIQLKKFHKFH